MSDRKRKFQGGIQLLMRRVDLDQTPSRLDVAPELWLRAEMEEQPNRVRRGPEIVQQLASSRPGQVFRRFDFDDDAVIHHYVQSLAGDVTAFVLDVDRHLSAH